MERYTPASTVRYRHRLKSAKGTGAWGRLQARLGVSVQVFSPGELRGQRSLLPAAPCDDKHRVLPTKDAHLSLGVQSFIGPRSW